MSTKQLSAAIAAAIAIVGFTSLAAPETSEARVYADIAIQVAPPPLRYEPVPPPRVGYVWVPGYWNWHHHRHVWVGGTWVRARHGYAYYPHRWEQRGDRWYLERGYWDRDGDGVPNRYDRYPNNPYRR
jgi:hypothetical protein